MTANSRSALLNHSVGTHIYLAVMEQCKAYDDHELMLYYNSKFAFIRRYHKYMHGRPIAHAQIMDA